ncbi:MAG: gamma-glutamylcyclotransferase, partial [Moraxella osloensis]|nr:gamma-glutamylcyclotransferase [Moraxella osloensis]
MMQHLFVYGTLAPNRDNHSIMTPINNGSWQPATIRG